jgi:cytochrome c biogenesis protein CcmG/thiol:disulfide interchange protein DsbE
MTHLHNVRVLTVLAFLAGALLVPVACGSTSGEQRGGAARTTEAGKSRKMGVGAAMPSIVVKELGGKRKIDLGALQGKVVLVDIWASWCGPCKEEMPLLDEMAARLKKSGIEVIAVSVDEDKESAQDFLSSREEWALTVAHDPKGKVPRILKPSKMPTSYVLDSEGIIRYINEGFERDDVKALETRLKALASEAS